MWVHLPILCPSLEKQKEQCWIRGTRTRCGGGGGGTTAVGAVGAVGGAGAGAGGAGGAGAGGAGGAAATTTRRAIGLARRARGLAGRARVILRFCWADIFQNSKFKV